MFKLQLAKIFSRNFFLESSGLAILFAVTLFSCSEENVAVENETDDALTEKYAFLDPSDTSNVSICEAEDIAASFMDELVDNDITLKSAGIRYNPRNTNVIPDGNMEPTLYVINLDPEGWCIVSATKKTQSILAYCDMGKFDVKNVQDGVCDWISETIDGIQYIRDNCKDAAMAPAIISPQDNTDDRDRPNNSTHVVAKPKVVKVCGPLLKTNWGQNYPYNYYCPDKGCASTNMYGHSKAGCVAIAAAQIVRYWSPYLPHTPYQWDDMPNRATDNPSQLEKHKSVSEKQYNGILSMARLIHDIGVAVDMEYGCSGSTAESKDIPNVLRRNYSFYSGGVYQKLADNKAENKIIENIDAKQPVIIRGKKNLLSFNNPGHAWICDGYKTLLSASEKSYLFHMNFGWDGNCNGWYTISLNVDELDSMFSNVVEKYNHWRYYITDIRGK